MSKALNERHMSKSIKTMKRVIRQNSFDDSAFRSSERTAPLELKCFSVGKSSMSKRPNRCGTMERFIRPLSSFRLFATAATPRVSYSVVSREPGERSGNFNLYFCITGWSVLRTHIGSQKKAFQGRLFFYGMTDNDFLYVIIFIFNK